MGCDIHLFCEYRENYDTWKCADHFRIRTDGVPDKVKIQSVNDYPKYLEPIPLYDNRSYAFFSLLADVRNSGDVKPMDDRKGLPHDVSDIVKAYSNYWGSDGHSHSWYTARELLKQKYDMEYKKPWLNSDEELENEELSWAYSSLSELCQEMVRRMAEVFYIYESSEAVIEERIRQNADRFRVVFWFDC